ncbi:MAG: glycosyltransferase family 2 protein [Candidatus Brocadiae bacterium]|nr:glycosyltransferase family 2 protein [Candidatus Brocadiia bacterium]
MPDPAGCSIIVVSWNTSALLAACLESVLRHAAGAELIVVDNGSADGSAERARGIGARVIANPTNRGFARAVNQGIDASTRPMIVLLNPDATIENGTLPELLRVFESDPAVGIAGSQLLDPDGSRQHSYDTFPSLATECLNKWLLRTLLPSSFPAKTRVLDAVTDVDSVIGACLAIPRAVLDRVGPLDERFFVFLEETDWCLRVRRAGFRVVHVPASRVVHLQGKAKALHPVLARIEYLKSLFLYFRKNLGTPAWLVLHAARLLKSGMNALFCCIAMILTLALIPSLRRRTAIHAGLFGWQLLGCPDGIGLQPADLPAPRPLPSFPAGAPR